MAGWEDGEAMYEGDAGTWGVQATDDNQSTWGNQENEDSNKL